MPVSLVRNDGVIYATGLTFTYSPEPGTRTACPSINMLMKGTSRSNGVDNLQNDVFEWQRRWCRLTHDDLYAQFSGCPREMRLNAVVVRRLTTVGHDSRLQNEQDTC